MIPEFKQEQTFPLTIFGAIYSKDFVPPPLLCRPGIFMIDYMEHGPVLSQCFSVVCQLLHAFQDLVVPGAFLLTVRFFHSLPRLFHRCSLYQQSSSWCLVSESLRNLLVSFHLGKYRSDKQITFQKNPRRICVCDSFPVTFFSSTCLPFDVSITGDKDLEGIRKLQEKAVIAYWVECNMWSQCETLNGPDL